MLLDELSIGTSCIIDDVTTTEDVATPHEAKEQQHIDVDDSESSTSSTTGVDLITDVATSQSDVVVSEEASTNVDLESSADEADNETDDDDKEAEKDEDSDKSEVNSHESPKPEDTDSSDDVTSAKQQKLSSNIPEEPLVKKSVIEFIAEASSSGVGSRPVFKDAAEMRTSTRLSGSGGDTTTSSQGGVGTLDGFDSDSGVSTISSCALPVFSDDAESTASSCVSPANEEMDVMAVKVVYGGHDILDLSGTLKTRPWDLQFTQLPPMNLAMFWQNRSQYHRLGNFGREEYKQLCCIECEFQYPIPN